MIITDERKFHETLEPFSAFANHKDLRDQLLRKYWVLGGAAEDAMSSPRLHWGRRRQFWARNPGDSV